MLKYKLNLGIGDIIQAKSQLIDIVNSGEEVYIAPNLTVLENRIYDKEEYFEFIMKFIHLIFNEPGFIIGLDQNCDPGDFFSLYKEGKKPKTINLVKQLVPSTGLDIESPYITINTKVRAGIECYSVVKNQFLDLLNSSGCKVVLMGEKNLADHNEYRYLVSTNNIQLIYEDLIGLNNVLDLTKEKLAIPNIEDLQSDCYIMNKAITNVTIGIGGSLVLSSSVGRCLSYINLDSAHYKAYEDSINCIFNSEGVR